MSQNGPKIFPYNSQYGLKKVPNVFKIVLKIIKKSPESSIKRLTERSYRVATISQVQFSSFSSQKYICFQLLLQKKVILFQLRRKNPI